MVGPDNENLGTLSLADALKKADEMKLDLIEISPKAKPPVAKITDFGQYRYDTKRKASVAKAKAHVVIKRSFAYDRGTAAAMENRGIVANWDRQSEQLTMWDTTQAPIAIRNGIVKTNPVEDIKAPRKAKTEMVFLTEDQVWALAEEINDPPPLQRGASHREGGYPDYALLVLFAAYTGLRAGESAEGRAPTLARPSSCRNMRLNSGRIRGKRIR